MRHFPRGPAVDRLEWILDGLDGTTDWGADTAAVLAPAFAALVPPAAYRERIRARSTSYRPLRIVGVESVGHTARARIGRTDGSTDVLTCTVEAAPPHRITETWIAGLVPASLTPRLPMDFGGYEIPRQEGRFLLVFSGVPGSGKSTLAEAMGARLGVPVFATDWLLGSLTPFGGRHLDGLLDIGDELLTTLAVRQLTLGQSAILDAPVEDAATRARWRSLARRAGADFRVVLCVCSDQHAHQQRAEGRVRGIPGWHDGADWTDISRRLAEFVPWDGDVLTVDTTAPHDDNIAAVLKHLTDG